MIPCFNACASHSALGVNMCSFSVLKTAQDAGQFVFAVLAPFSLINIHLLGAELDTFRTLKVHFDSVFQGLVLPLRVWGTCVHFQCERQHRMLANFGFCGFGPFSFQTALFRGRI